MPVDEKAAVLRRLGAVRSGDGWTARCPGHDDRRASLSLRPLDNGRGGEVPRGLHERCDCIGSRPSDCPQPLRGSSWKSRRCRNKSQPQAGEVSHRRKPPNRPVRLASECETPSDAELLDHLTDVYTNPRGRR